MNNKKIFRRKKLITTVIIVSLLGSACQNQEPKAQTPQQAMRVRLQEIASETIVDSSEYVGALEAKQRVNLAPKINGRIVKIFLQEGDTVTKGQLIAELEPTKEEEEVNAATSQVSAAMAEFNRTEAELIQREAERGSASGVVDTRRADVAGAQADLENARANLQSAEAEVEDAKAQLQLAQVEYDRSKNLLGQGVVAQQDFDFKERDLKITQAQLQVKLKQRDAARASVLAAQTSVQANQGSLKSAIDNLRAAQKRVDAARALVDQAKASIGAAQGQKGSIEQDLLYNRIQAPISGILGDFNKKKIGDYLQTGENFTTITDNQEFNLNVSIPIEYRERIRLGLPVETLNSDGTVGVKGEVTYISPLVDQNAQAVLVKMTFRNDGTLRDQQYVKVRIIWEQKPGILIPAIAVSSIGQQKFVFVAQEETQKGKNTLVAKQIPVTVGNIQGQSYQVLSGIQPGDKIALNKILELKDGRPIVEEPVGK
jgi:RND family efflux transporter MFP subunit